MTRGRWPGRSSGCSDAASAGWRARDPHHGPESAARSRPARFRERYRTHRRHRHQFSIRKDRRSPGCRARRSSSTKTTSGRRSAIHNERVPVGLGVLIDISDSMFGARIQDARRRSTVPVRAARLRRPVLSAGLQSPAARPHRLDRHAGGSPRVRSIALKPSGGTAVYDAVTEALPMIEQRRASAPRS